MKETSQGCHRKQLVEDFENEFNVYFPEYNLLRTLRKLARDKELIDASDGNLGEDTLAKCGWDIVQLEEHNEELMKNISNVDEKVRHERVRKNVARCKEQIAVLEAKCREDVRAGIEELNENVLTKLRDISNQNTNKINYYRDRIFGNVTRSDLYGDVARKSREVLKILREENVYLRTLSLEPVSDDYLCVLKTLNEIYKGLKRVEIRIDKFKGTKFDVEYVKIDSELLLYVKILDGIEISDEVLRQKKNEVSKMFYLCCQKLKANTVKEY